LEGKRESLQAQKWRPISQHMFPVTSSMSVVFVSETIDSTGKKGENCKIRELFTLLHNNVKHVTFGIEPFMHTKFQGCAYCDD